MPVYSCAFRTVLMAVVPNCVNILLFCRYCTNILVTDDWISTTRRMTAAALQEEDARTDVRPNAMALMPMTDARESPSTSSSSVQTAFQMSLTVLSFLAFGGYVISLVAQNMRKPHQNDGMTAPKPLKSVVVNQNRRPILMRTPTTVSFARRKRNPRHAYIRANGGGAR